MDADDERLLVVGAVEDADHAARRERDRRAPQEVVVELLHRGDLEARHLDALRVDPAHDVLDRAVLPGRVEGLDDDEQRRPVLRREPCLVLLQQLGAALEETLSLGLLEAGGVVGIVGVWKAHPRTGFDTQAPRETAEAIVVLVRHGGHSLWTGIASRSSRSSWRTGRRSAR